MSFIDNFKSKFIAQRKSEESLYSIVANEMANGIRNEALWLKALELAKGSNDRQISEYIKLRVQSLKDDIHIVNNFSEKQSLIQHNLDIEVFISMIEKGASIEKINEYFSSSTPENICQFINTSDACDDYPLHVSVKKEKIDILEWLLLHGADLNTKNYWDETPLDIAVRKEKSELQKILMNNTA